MSSLQTGSRSNQTRCKWDTVYQQFTHFNHRNICLFPFDTFFVLFESRVVISFHQQRIKIWVSMNLEAAMLSTSPYLYEVSKGPTKAS